MQPFEMISGMKEHWVEVGAGKLQLPDEVGTFAPLPLNQEVQNVDFVGVKKAGYASMRQTWLRLKTCPSFSANVLRPKSGTDSACCVIIRTGTDMALADRD